jgi:hypothetical protein
VLAELATAAVLPWLAPLSFASHPTGWDSGASGTYYIVVGRAHERAPVSVAWTATVRCPDCDHSTAPNATLRALHPNDIVIWASIQRADATGWPPSGRPSSSLYSLRQAYRLPCCDGAAVAGGVWELYAFGPARAYEILVRVFWGSPPTHRMRAAAQNAIDRLDAPAAR